MLKPATRAIAPSTMTTNNTEVSQNAPINWASGPREARPNLPTVYAMAPKAPTGANFIRILTTPNTAWVKASTRSTSGFERGPTLVRAKPLVDLVDALTHAVFGVGQGIHK